MRRSPFLPRFLPLAPVALAAAPTPKDQLLVPPPNADHFVVVSEAGKHGDEWCWTTAGRKRRLSANPSCFAAWCSSRTRSIQLGTDGMPIDVVIRGVTPSGDSAETFAIDQGTAAGRARSTRAGARIRASVSI